MKASDDDHTGVTLMPPESENREVAPVDDHTIVTRSLRDRVASIEQSWLILMLTAAFMLTLSAVGVGMLNPSNLADIGRSMGPLLILGTGAALVILGRGIDLSAASIAAVAAQLFVWLTSVQGFSEPRALLLTAAVSLALGVFNGILIVWAEVPALFVTLATWQLYLGAFRIFVSEETNAVLPDEATAVESLGSGNLFGIPSTLVAAVAVVLIAGVVLRFTSFGWFYRAVGDNQVTAKLTGIPERPLRFASYIVSSLLAGLTGLVLLGMAGSYSTVYGSSEAILFDAITIAIIGGFSLAGGRGTMFGVVVAALLVAAIQSGMTLLDFSVVATTLTKSLVLLLAIALDAWLHPESEETVRAGDL